PRIASTLLSREALVPFVEHLPCRLEGEMMPDRAEDPRLHSVLPQIVQRVAALLCHLREVVNCLRKGASALRDELGCTRFVHLLRDYSLGALPDVLLGRLLQLLAQVGFERCELELDVL